MTNETKKGDFFTGASVKPTSGGPMIKGIVKPKKKEEKTTEDQDPSAGIKGGQAALGDGEVKPTNCPLANVSIKEPVKANCESNELTGLFKFDKIWQQLTEANDTMPIGGDIDAANANLDGDSFNDDEGDFNALEDEDELEDEVDDEAAANDDARTFLMNIRDQINEFLGEGDDEFVDNDETELDNSDVDEELPPEPNAAPPPAPAPQTESWQRKTALGPKMSDKVPGKLGKKKKSGKCGKGCLKKNTTLQDAKGKKVPLSKFSPKMSDKVSRLKKGDLF